jgi:hypothetical protein
MNHLDDVRGEIIGGDTVQWVLTYQDRQQGAGYAAADAEAIAAAKARQNALYAELGAFLFGQIYPDKNAWMLKLRP